MKLFLDVGAHVGETLEAAKSTDLFDHYYAFEPVLACVEKLKSLEDPRVTILPFGLSDTNKRAIIYNAGTLGGSLYEGSSWTKPYSLDIRPLGINEECEFRKASEWFKENLTGDDLVVVKINCEGAEVEILEDLLESGEIKKVSFLNVAWDIELFEGMQCKKKAMEAWLKAEKVKFIRSDRLYDPPFDFSPYLSHGDYTRYWLEFAIFCTKHAGPKAGKIGGV